MKNILKNIALYFLGFVFFGIAYSLESDIALNQQRYTNFISTIAFADSLNQAINTLAGEDFPRNSIVVYPLDGGMTSTKIFVLTINDQKYVLRTLNPRHSIESKKNEIRAHSYAAEIGLAPPLSYVDENLQFMLMPYIDGRILTIADLDDSNIITTIGTSLAKLHNYQGNFDQHKPQTYRTEKHFERAQKQQIAFPSVYNALYEKFYKEGLEINKNTEDLVLCHADLNPANIIVAADGSLYFIDWTSATWDNRYTDLGYFSLTNGLTDEQSHCLVKSYFGGTVTDTQWKMFKNARNRTSFVTATVWFDYSESKEDKMVSEVDRIKKLDMLLNDPHLKTGLEYAADHEVVSPISGSKEAIRLYALGFLKTYMDSNP